MARNLKKSFRGSRVNKRLFISYYSTSGFRCQRQSPAHTAKALHSACYGPCMLLTFPIYECRLIPTACCEVGSNIISHLKTRKPSLYEVQVYRASKWEKRDLTLNRRIPGFTLLTTVFVRILQINRINRIYTSIHIQRERETDWF